MDSVRIPTRIVSKRSPDGTVIAHPGDVVTCPEGHPVWRVVEAVVTGATVNPKWLRRMDCDEPPAPGVAPPCPLCGGAVCPPIADRPGRFALFINGHLAGDEDVR